MLSLYYNIFSPKNQESTNVKKHEQKLVLVIPQLCQYVYISPYCKLILRLLKYDATHGNSFLQACRAVQINSFFLHFF